MNHITKGYAALVHKLTNYPTLGSDNTNVVDVLVGLLLAISPLLQHYKGIGVNAGFIVLILCLPYVCLKLLFRFRNLPWKNALIALPLVLFQVYRVLAHGTTFMELAHAAVLCGYFVAIALGGINLKYVAHSAYWVAMAAGIGIIIQSICYYLFDFHLQLVATGLLLEESEAWIGLVETGLININGSVSAIYRPSAFFLEPSHMFLYLVPSLFLLLLSPEMNRVKRISAVVLSVGLILSTSGMGIAVVAGAWLLQLGFSNGKENLLRFKHFFNKKNIFRCIAFALVFVMIALSLPFLRYSVLRIFMGSRAVNEMIAAEQAKKEPQTTIEEELKEEPDKTPTEKLPETQPVETPEQPSVDVEKLPQEEQPSVDVEKLPQEEQAPSVDKESQTEKEPSVEAKPQTGGSSNKGSTAISGRTERAISLIRYRMSGAQYLIGVSDSVDNIEFNLPGFFATMYKYGILGVLLSYLFYLCCAVFAKGPYRWMAIIILMISFFSAHTHGTFYMLFYVLMLMDGIIKMTAKNRTPSQTIE